MDLDKMAMVVTLLLGCARITLMQSGIQERYYRPFSILLEARRKLSYWNSSSVQSIMLDASKCPCFCLWIKVLGWALWRVKQIKLPAYNFVLWYYHRHDILRVPPVIPCFDIEISWGGSRQSYD